MLSFIRTSSSDPVFQQLVQALNAELASRDGADHPLAQYNPTTNLLGVLLAYQNGTAVACGAIGEYDDDAVEIKRMYVTPTARGQKIGALLLTHLEGWAQELGYCRYLLFMGFRQPEAMRLYQNNGYRIIPPYGKLREIEDCICMEKELGN